MDGGFKNAIAASIAGGLLGGIVALPLSSFICCSLLWPEMNLCGVPALIFGVPAGILIGSFAGAFFVIASRKNGSPADMLEFRRTWVLIFSLIVGLGGTISVIIWAALYFSGR